MDIIVSDEAQQQLKIIKLLGDSGNKDYAALFYRIALYLKSLKQVKNIDELKLGINDRHKNNRLSGDMSDVATRDIDPRHRMTYFDRENNAVILTTLSHYNIELLKGKKLFTPNKIQLIKIKRLPSDDFQMLKERSKLLVEKMVAVVQQDPQNIDYEFFNKSVQSKYICPVSIDTITKRLGDYVSVSVDKNHGDMDQALLDFFSKNEKVIENTTANAIGLGNVASVIMSNQDLKKLLLTKLEVEKTIMRHFSDLAFYVNKRVSNSHRHEMLVSIANDFLKGYDKVHDQKVVFSNDKYQGFNFRHDYELIRRIDERLRQNISTDLENCIKNNASIDVLNKESKTEFFRNLFPETKNFTSVFHEVCRKLDLLPNGKSRESHEAICKMLGIEKGSLLKRKDSENRINQSQQIIQEKSKIKKGHSR